ncbi:PulJ/GspJ family protein [Noviherbaspirillum galbum]|uniref:Type 4 secretion system PilS N-terminal domain-containing protein n=1 Tax=Noviherbaspirillum galbum TaxID=2709383 RepID=A0A6B3SYL2_9BURK|nr:hypothetical protein [Noviherbaspirillum galbum]NEX64526.1 hypothetical protein [Noviherbaspirillum galbum]
MQKEQFALKPVPRAFHAGRATLPHKQAGLTIAETLLVLAIGASIAVVGFSGYKYATAALVPTQLVEDTALLAAKLKQTFGVTNDFSNVTASSLASTSFFPYKSFKAKSGTTGVLADINNNTVVLTGGTSSFAVVITPNDSDQCLQLAGSASQYAYNINIGTGMTSSGGTVTGGTAYKAGTTLTPSVLATNCTVASTMIGMEIR